MCNRVFSGVLVSLFFVLSASLDESIIKGSGHTVGYGELEEEWRGEIIHLSWSPRAFLVKNFMSPEECEHLIATNFMSPEECEHLIATATPTLAKSVVVDAKSGKNATPTLAKSVIVNGGRCKNGLERGDAQATPTLAKSVVVDAKTGKNVESDIRTSSGTFLELNQDPVITKLEKRVAQISLIPQENQEGFQVLHYELGQKYEPHHDSFADEWNARVEKGGQRVVTLLMYLKDVEEGGETVFPQAEEKVGGEGWSECAKQGFAVRPEQGDAVLFYSLKPDGTEDPASLHGSCPVLKGD
eukprot:gene28069-31175_t